MGVCSADNLVHVFHKGVIAPESALHLVDKGYHLTHLSAHAEQLLKNGLLSRPSAIGSCLCCADRNSLGRKLGTFSRNEILPSETYCM